jgi:hypothetical protein
MKRNRSGKLSVSVSMAASVLALSGVAFAQPIDDVEPAAPSPSHDRPIDNPSAKNADSKERKAKNLVYLELLGNGGVYSINYERMLTDDLSARLGFSYLSVSTSAGSASAKANLVTAPALLNYTVGGRNHRAEVGAGATLVYVSASSEGGSGVGASGEGVAVLGTGVVGYRYAPADGGFVFRAGFTPLFGKGGFLPWGGMSFGGTF